MCFTILLPTAADQGEGGVGWEERDRTDESGRGHQVRELNLHNGMEAWQAREP